MKVTKYCDIWHVTLCPLGNPHRWSRPERGLVLLVGQEIGALLKLHVLHLRNEVIGKSPHPLLAHVLQPLVPQLTGSVCCHVYFLPAFPGMHWVQCIDLPGLSHDQDSLAEFHGVVLDATLVAVII